MNMRTLLLLTASLFMTAAVYAQAAPLNVSNFANCEFWVIAHADTTVCGSICTSGPICVIPGATVAIPPCGGPSFTWNYVEVIPVVGCTNPCSTPVGISPPAAGCAPASASANHCICGPYTADFFLVPGQLSIF